MYEIADQVNRWRAAGRDALVAQVVATHGFSSRDPADAAAWVDGETPHGSVLAAIDTTSLVGLAPGLHERVISDDDAVAAGLACGGRASVLVQRVADLPDDVWARAVDRAPLCVITELRDGAVAATTAYTPQNIRDADVPGFDVPRLFGRGTSTTELAQTGAGRASAVVALWPVPTLVVVGDGLLAAALTAIATVLGWSARCVPLVDDAVTAVRTLHRSDALVVLSHSRDVDGPTLAAALAGEVGYVGALGSRHTQAARREWLTAYGVPEGDQARVHGPAGLDIEAHTPGEIAISIVAEIIATRAPATGGALRDRGGPIHPAGVSAPPPRH